MYNRGNTTGTNAASRLNANACKTALFLALPLLSFSFNQFYPRLPSFSLFFSLRPSFLFLFLTSFPRSRVSMSTSFAFPRSFHPEKKIVEMFSKCIIRRVCAYITNVSGESHTISAHRCKDFPMYKVVLLISLFIHLYCNIKCKCFIYDYVSIIYRKRNLLMKEDSSLLL